MESNEESRIEASCVSQREEIRRLREELSQKKFEVKHQTHLFDEVSAELLASTRDRDMLREEMRALRENEERMIQGIEKACLKSYEVESSCISQGEEIRRLREELSQKKFEVKHQTHLFDEVSAELLASTRDRDMLRGEVRALRENEERMIQGIEKACLKSYGVESSCILQEEEIRRLREELKQKKFEEEEIRRLREELTQKKFEVKHQTHLFDEVSVELLASTRDRDMLRGEVRALRENEERMIQGIEKACLKSYGSESSCILQQQEDIRRLREELSQKKFEVSDLSGMEEQNTLVLQLHNRLADAEL